MSEKRFVVVVLAVAIVAVTIVDILFVLSKASHSNGHGRDENREKKRNDENWFARILITFYQTQHTHIHSGLKSKTHSINECEIQNTSSYKMFTIIDNGIGTCATERRIIERERKRESACKFIAFAILFIFANVHIRWRECESAKKWHRFRCCRLNFWRRSVERKRNWQREWEKKKRRKVFQVYAAILLQTFVHNT